MADYKSETRVADCGARVEVGTVTYEGRDYAALGSVVDEKRGIITCYPHLREDGTYEARMWGGKIVGPMRLVRRYRGGFGHKTEMYAWSMVYNGRTYSGRNGGMVGGPDCLVIMRAGRVLT